jgi:hypothetical protein
MVVVEGVVCNKRCGQMILILGGGTWKSICFNVHFKFHDSNAKTFVSYLNDFLLWEKMTNSTCHNPTLTKCGGEAQHLEKLEVWSPPGLPNVQSSTARPKTPRIEAFLVSLERSWNVNIENGLALAIQTFAAQVMGKRRAGSQTGSLTPDH